MTKMYYKKEYTEKQWTALIDMATELNCAVSYDKYGLAAKIDSTNLENDLCKNFPDSAGTVTNAWAENIHKMLQEIAGLL